MSNLSSRLGILRSSRTFSACCAGDFYRHSGPLDLEPSVGGGRSAGACPSHAFNCLKQDGQDCQDVQDGGRLGIRDKGLEDLNVYRNQQQQGVKVRRTLICSGGCDACEGQALALRAPRRVFFVVRGPVSCDLHLILAILSILAILLQTRETFRSSRTFSAYCASVL